MFGWFVIFRKVFPAYAGVILFAALCVILFVCVPRVCGGDPY